MRQKHLVHTTEVWLSRYAKSLSVKSSCTTEVWLSGYAVNSSVKLRFASDIWLVSQTERPNLGPRNTVEAKNKLYEVDSVNIKLYEGDRNLYTAISVKVDYFDLPTQ